jgi:hypothetical protein
VTLVEAAVEEQRGDNCDDCDSRLEGDVKGRAVVGRVDENEPTDENGRRPGDDRASKTEMDRPQLSLPYIFITRLFRVFLLQRGTS